jgi:PAS domain S-box-containing protein
MNENLTPQAHEQNEQHFKALMENITNFAIYRLVYDNSQPHRFKVVFVSPSIVDIMGVSDPMKFETWFEDIQPDDKDRLAKNHARALETGKFDGTYRVYHPQKERVRWVHEVSSCLSGKNGQPMHVMGLILDVTEQKRAEALIVQHRKHLETIVATRTKELGGSEARYRGIVENMHEMVCRFLPDGTITFKNRSCRAFMGGETNKFSGNDFFRWTSLNDQENKVEKDFKACAEKTKPMPYPIRMLKCDGSECWIRWSGHRLLDKHGSLTEYQAVGRDITDILKNQEYEERQEKLQRRTQKLEAIGTLSAGIAHDFNNIMAVILGNVQLAMDDVSKGTRARKNLDEIYDSCLRAKNMVKQILVFAREGDQGVMSLNLIPVIKESIRFLESAIPSTIEIRRDIDEVDFVRADPTQVGQILMNLGTNAAQAMGRAPGVMDISLKNIRIHDGHKDRFRVSAGGKYVKLKVADTGCGMPKEVVSRVFDPYFTTRKDGEGTGMGLAVVHGIIENHGGVIWVKSEPGKGSTFHVLFPAVEAVSDEAEMDHYQPIFQGTGRILIVDDEKALLEAEMEMLDRLGYEVTGKSSAMEALKTFRRQPDGFDLIYTDMTMPGMTGLALAKKILQIRPRMPVILYSGHRNLADDKEILNSGIKAFLTKPMILEDLAIAIREVLDEARERKS